MLGRLMNNGLIEEEQLGQNMLRVRPGRTFADAKGAYRRQLEAFEPVLQKTTDLFLRVQTTHQAELVSTVLYAARQLRNQKRSRPSEMDVLNAVIEWKIRRRPPIKTEEVAHTVRNLAALGWLDVSASSDLPVPEEEVSGV